MKNIENAITFINENNGTASLDEIFDAYIRKWHVLPVPENKQKIKGTLELYDGNKVFYDKETDLWRTKPKAITPDPQSVVPSAGSSGPKSGIKEEFLGRICFKFNQVLEGSSFRFERNSTVGEQNLDLFVIGNQKRIGYVYAKKNETVDFCLYNEFYTKLYDKESLPAAGYERRSSTIRKFEKISIDDALLIVEQLKKA